MSLGLRGGWGGGKCKKLNKKTNKTIVVVWSFENLKMRRWVRPPLHIKIVRAWEKNMNKFITTQSNYESMPRRWTKTPLHIKTLKAQRWEDEQNHWCTLDLWKHKNKNKTIIVHHNFENTKVGKQMKWVLHIGLVKTMKAKRWTMLTSNIKIVKAWRQEDEQDCRHRLNLWKNEDKNTLRKSW